MLSTRESRLQWINCPGSNFMSDTCLLSQQPYLHLPQLLHVNRQLIADLSVDEVTDLTKQLPERRSLLSQELKHKAAT